MGNRLFRFKNRLSGLFYRLKGAFIYRWIFGQFGKRSILRRPLLIANPQFIHIGDRVSIRDGARLEAVQDKKDRVPILRIGNGTSIEQWVHIVSHNRVEIGNEVCIAGHCCILDTTHPYDDVSDPRNIVAKTNYNEDSFVVIGDGAFLGYGAVVLPNVRIGKKCVIGALSVVAADVPDYSVAVGSPARVIKQYDFTVQRWLSV